MDLPLMSVLIPVYNGENHLEGLIKALFQATYPRLEFLFFDDGSSDKTWQILQQYQNDQRVKIYKAETNSGAGHARNFLLSKASGEFIALQDADDLFATDRFLKLARFLVDNPDVDVVGSSAKLIAASGEQWGVLTVKSKPTCFDWYFQRSMVHASIVFRHKIANAALYNENIRYGEDYYFLTSLYLKGHTFRNILDPLYEYKIEQKELHQRAYRSFSLLLQSKLRIATLFPWPQRGLFLSVSICILAASFVRRLVKSKISSYSSNSSKDF